MTRGLIFGAFDPLHYGHVRLMRRAKEYCKELYVITESNEIIHEEKGRDAFTSEADRVQDIKGIKYADYVFMRDDEFNRKYWFDMVQPTVIFYGSDWKDKDHVAKHWGAEVIYLPRTPDIDSTKLRKCSHHT